MAKGPSLSSFSTRRLQHLIILTWFILQPGQFQFPYFWPTSAADQILICSARVSCTSQKNMFWMHFTYVKDLKLDGRSRVSSNIWTQNNLMESERTYLTCSVESCLVASSCCVVAQARCQISNARSQINFGRSSKTNQRMSSILFVVKSQLG